MDEKKVEEAPAKTRKGGGVVIVFVLLALVVGFGGGFALGMATGAATVVIAEPQPFAQTGKLTTVRGQTGVVNFPIPYRHPPNVELSLGSWNYTIVTECTETGFTWKNTGEDDQWNNATGTWTARGLPK